LYVQIFSPLVILSEKTEQIACFYLDTNSVVTSFTLSLLHARRPHFPVPAATTTPQPPASFILPHRSTTMLRSLTFLQRRAPSSASSAVPFETRRLAVQSMGSQVDNGATSTNSSGHNAEKRNGISSRQYSYASKVLPTNQPTTARPILNQLTCTFSTHHVSSSHHRYSSSSPISSRDNEEELQAPIMQTGDGYLGKRLRLLSVFERC
jgi:hypothetical protein